MNCIFLYNRIVAILNKMNFDDLQNGFKIERENEIRN